MHRSEIYTDFVNKGGCISFYVRDILCDVTIAVSSEKCIGLRINACEIYVEKFFFKLLILMFLKNSKEIKG